MRQNELGEFAIDGHSGVASAGFYVTFRGGPFAVGQSLAVRKPDNGRANARLAQAPAFRPRVTVAPSRGTGAKRPGNSVDLAPDAARHDSANSGAKVTTADVLEALHQATGLPIAADYYTRLYPADAVSMRNQPLFAALNQLADTMRLRWSKDDAWLEFRSSTFYDDRVKEVPNRLLNRWATSRLQHGFLTLDDLVEIAQLSDAQLDAAEMAEGARDGSGLVEWDLARQRFSRPHLRLLGKLTPEQRQEAAGPEGLAFTRMSLAHQQQFISFLFPPNDPVIQSLASRFGSTRLLEELKDAVLRVEYTPPGWFQWGDPAMSGQWFRWVVPMKPGRDGWRVPRPTVRERTRELALQALRRVDPQIREAAVHTWALPDQPDAARRPPPLEAQIFPTELSLTFVYIPGRSNGLPLYTVYNGSPSWQPSS
jgi:hypothetical protein